MPDRHTTDERPWAAGAARVHGTATPAEAAAKEALTDRSVPKLRCHLDEPQPGKEELLGRILASPRPPSARPLRRPASPKDREAARLPQGSPSLRPSTARQPFQRGPSAPEDPVSPRGTGP